jgi:hypothetical protein
MLRSGLGDENPRIVEDRPRLERAGRDRGRREGQVEHTSLQRAEEVEVDRRVDHLDSDLGMTRAEPADDLRQDPDADALVGADAQVTADTACELFDVDLRGVETGDDGIQVTEQNSAGLRRPERAAALLTRDHLGAHDPLEARDLLADRRGRVPEDAGRAFEGPLVCDRAQGREMPKFETDPVGYRIGLHGL